MGHLGSDETVLLIILAVVGGILLVMLAIQALVCWLLYDAWKRIPPPYLEGEPWHAWLLMVPLLGLIMGFFVHPRIARSYRNYLAAWNIHDAGDCGEQIGQAYAICAACSVIPYLGSLAAMAGFVLIIVFLVKITGLKKRLVPVQPPPVG